MTERRTTAAFAAPVEFDDIADALADGVIDEAEAAALRDQVWREYTAGWDGIDPLLGGPDHASRYMQSVERVSRDPDGPDVVLKAPVEWPTPYVTPEERARLEAEERSRRIARARAAQTVQLTMFDDEAAPSVVYEPPTDHPDFDRFAILLSEFAVWTGRWPRFDDIASPPDDLTLPTLEQVDECGGLTRLLDAVMIERPVEGIA